MLAIERKHHRYEHKDAQNRLAAVRARRGRCERDGHSCNSRITVRMRSSYEYPDVMQR